MPSSDNPTGPVPERLANGSEPFHDASLSRGDQARMALEAAERDGLWMACFFSVRDRRIVMHRFTSNFPFDDMPAALDLLRRDLESAGKPGVVGTRG